ncbi:protein of unknown function [Nitrospina watsonii]|uniref:Uncharacterized protein n=1 Tax=Nitrospina watsonii TaxID=1323948 RepID=A0ABM9HBS5_9BACT|nr:protein of unknown function [Nitrospina watsonii]
MHKKGALFNRLYFNKLSGGQIYKTILNHSIFSNKGFFMKMAQEGLPYWTGVFHDHYYSIRYQSRHRNNCIQNLFHFFPPKNRSGFDLRYASLHFLLSHLG